ncbi:LysM peptidoglycan-binding domain-containing protein [Cohnella sp. GbtcB17]|uniref:LysM peptidoglycan-binding domain-containing protein n=1 Tax=Cohnella sp. GbtcB17 TaxID=2824762 RepID=UPI001C303D2D|nr:LysM peptidoglycan-binding domain-containing protein [Cohnella sp. GbtcB17]
MVQVQLLGSESLKSNEFTYMNRKRGTGRDVLSDSRVKRAGLSRLVDTFASVKGLRLILIPLVALMIYAGLSMMSASAEPQSVNPAAKSESTVTVDAGDTLWSIAEAAKPAGMKTVAAVHLIMKRNGLTSSAIASGQRLVLPAKLSASHG